jgi:crotonobetainyl-CoA:carnitine CoA-transferase CaiB-like acyl-CoA transferase
MKNFEPLKGVRILDLTSVVVGPVCTWRLAELGAEIVKVESPDGDLMRGLGGASPTGQHSGAYLHFNRGKRNICLDLKRPDALKVIAQLVESADVVVANMRPDALARLGLDAATIRAKHPNKVHCLITGYGTDGPYAGLPTYDSVVQGATGMAGLMLARDGEPAYVPLLICDHVAGEIAAGTILAALIELRQSGHGSSLEIPMFETMAVFVLQEHLAQHSFEPPVGPIGDLRLLSPYNKPVKTADGWISFTVNTDSQVRAFLKATDRENLIQDARFATVAGRAKHVADWFEHRGAALITRTTEEWLAILRAVDIAAQPCHTLTTLVQDPHLKAVGLIDYEEHVTEGRSVALRSSIRVNDANLQRRPPAQPRGFETEALLKELGYEPAEIEALISSGAASSALSVR